MTPPVAPKRYRALEGRIFKDIGPNGMNRTFRILSIDFMPFHQWGPWVVRCVAHGWNGYSGARFRKVDRFFSPGEYEEIK